MQATKLRGARTNNLQNLDLDIEPGTLVAIVGPSGAGKSSLAFGTLYAEGQRRYVESFSTYARQFLERMARPPVDELDPVPAAIAVDRQAPIKTSRSTVGTMTELTDYAKSVWARAAELTCPSCERVVRRDNPQDAAKAVLRAAADRRITVTYPVDLTSKEQFVGVREALVASGYRRVRLGEEVKDLDDVRPSDLFGDAPEAKATKKKAEKKSTKKSTKASKVAEVEAPLPKLASLEVVADRLVARSSERSRLVEALEMAMAHGGGRVDVLVEGGERLQYSSGLHCAHCDKSFRDATPGLFSFNSPIGACESCRGFGRTIGVDWQRVIPNKRLTLDQGAIKAWAGKSSESERKELAKWAKEAGIPMDVPLDQFTDGQMLWLLDGDGRAWNKGWYGLKGWFEWIETRAYKMHVRIFLARFRSYDECQACHGSRLKPEALHWRVDGKNLAEFYKLSVDDALEFVVRAEKRYAQDPPTRLAFRECHARLQTLSDVGLEYLTLDRPSRTLSGGESQRVALTSALGALLSGSMFVLDEPTVGLHPNDVEKLFRVVRRLSDGDNITIVVEHDPAFLRGADRIIELGPGAGDDGGRIVFDGTPAALAKKKTATSSALMPKRDERPSRRQAKGTLRVRGARGHNLRNVDLEIPLGVLTCVTGVSGSGKSSLILETLVPAIQQRLLGVGDQPLDHEGLDGADAITHLVHVDQSPLGRTSRGNPATYLGVWELFRKRFAQQPLAKERDYGPGYFSFNVDGGRCEACKGEGAETVEMQFLADVTFSCPECQGRRFVGPVLDVTWKDKNVADVLEMTGNDVLAHFAGEKEIESKLRALIDVGLGYVRLGQPLSTFSGGEAQRLKLAAALSEVYPGTLVVLDEPTAGLHHVDVSPLLKVFDRLVDRGCTVIVVEHEMRVAAYSDWVIDIGPGPGEKGGRIVAAGSPESVSKAKASLTAPHLRDVLSGVPRAPEAAPKKAKKLIDTRRIRVEGAREHNLKNVSIDLPRDQLIVVTGPSGSGKSTLTFDVIHAEAQRRYLETLSPFARQFLPQLPRPNVDRVTGLPPSVTLEQRVTRGGANSTVATVTEIAHYLRLLYARAGLLHCPDCKVPIAPRQASVLADDMRTRFGKDAEAVVLAPVVRGRKGHHGPVFVRAAKEKVAEARVDGVFLKVTRGLKLARFKEHDVDFVIGRLPLGEAAFGEALRRALSLGDGVARVVVEGEEVLLSSTRACASCGKGFPELDPRFFSFNTKQGACETCEGKGVLVETQGRGKNAKETYVHCTDCDGSRLSKLARSVTVNGKPITDILTLSVDAAADVARDLVLDGRSAEVGRAPMKELRARIEFLREVGLGYLGLSRPANTLSGGETQRVRLAAQLGSGLTGLLYVLDEPTIGLHPRDTRQLLTAIRKLVTKGCTVLIVEHDADTIRAADHLVDVGPTGGVTGGHIVAAGKAEDVLANTDSVTSRSIARKPPIPAARRVVDKNTPRIEVLGATQNNLKNANLSIPLGKLVAITGVSGSGKSTLVREILLPATRRALGLEADEPGAFKTLRGFESLKRAIEIDQSPIGRTPRSVPATYIGIWDELRKILAASPEARARGFTASRFSFNVSGGRCPECEGQGSLSVEMSFMPEVTVLCEACGGRRFTKETLIPKLHELDASELLELDVAQAADVLSGFSKIAAPLKTLTELGLGYLKLGQPSNTLSGGEAQRIKLVSELGASSAGSALYVMDEPTTGLHRDDVERLITLLHKLVDRGDTVVVIEHHTDIMAAADWIIDLGPEGGAGGGTVVAEGTPEHIATCATHTGVVLAEEIGVSPRRTNAAGR
jgi:excinuclease ABC subunit A